MKICKQCYIWVGKSTTGALFGLRTLIKIYIGQKELHCVVMDFEEAYDTVQKELWYYWKKSWNGEVRVIQHIHDGSRTKVKCAAGLNQ